VDHRLEPGGVHVTVAEEALDGDRAVLLPHVEATAAAHRVRRQRVDVVFGERVVGPVE
jgi:hypothetical protein